MPRQLPAMCPSCLRYQCIPAGAGAGGGPHIRFNCEFCCAGIDYHDAGLDPLVTRVREAAQAKAAQGPGAVVRIAPLRRWFGRG